MFRTPRERAEEAQVGFAAAMAAHKAREVIAEELLSVFSTAEMAIRDTHGIAVQHGHKNLRESDPERWKQIEMKVWGAIHDERPPYTVLQIVDKFTRSLLGFQLLPFQEIWKRVPELVC